MVSDIYYVIGIVAGILFMIWCVTSGKKQPRSVSTDKPKEKDPRRIDNER